MARYHLPLLAQMLHTFFSKPETVKYPFGPANIAPGFRGRIVMHAHNCVGCSMCVRDCPTGALELNRQSRKAYQLVYHPDRCAYCGQCELSCKFDAIHLDAAFHKATQDRESLRVVLVNRTEPED